MTKDLEGKIKLLFGAIRADQTAFGHFPIGVACLHFGARSLQRSQPFW